jgi:hypothetical protein
MLFSVTEVAHAQDTLYKVDGYVLMVKIKKVNATQVKYLPYADLDGLTHVINKGNVLKIIYESGLIEDFSKSVAAMTAPVPVVDPIATDFGRNFISLDVLDLLSSISLTFGYEYTFKSGLFGMKVPLSFGLNNESGYYGSNVFGTGLDLNLYPFGQGKSKFFYGPSFEYKKFKTTNMANDVHSAYAMLFQAGFLFQPFKHFNISVTAGIGYARLIRDDYLYESKGDVATRLGLNIGYKF